MNILLINYEYPPIGAGASNATFNMAKSIVELGHTPIVVTSAYKEWKGRSTEDGIIVYRIPAGRKYQDHSGILQMMQFLISCLIRIRKITKQEKIDKSIAFFTIPCGPISWYLKRKYGIPYIVSLRGGDVPGTEPKLDKIHKMLYPLRKIIFKNSCRIIANSKGLASLSEKRDPFPVHVIPNGVDCNFFETKKYSLNKNPEILLLFVGRFQAQKNLTTLIREFAKTSDVMRNLRILLVGNGPLKESIFQLIDDLKIQGQVDWVDWQDKKALAHIYKSADVFINPSLYEGMPNTVMEAMASGLPVIASDIFGNNDLVIDGITGRLFSLDSNEELHKSILELAGSFEVRKKMGNSGRKRVQENFSWLKVTEDYINILKEAQG